ncbi:unnamed protein product [Rotaria sp. Silwood2]|nr:unnamed protein product [Rotaria sp. Silwood2]CAF3129703.1 unnamed protein product [Rotaria sp. Silwood2]CAF3340321.1 unnamed protein product [Rotaria sp. Silwood2]CAF3357812.1 unnamed protein product [Rotaria sp. Silwood2]CAF4280777.1 unnamed protein product [Rotaria sp. Silwood2]
MSPIGKRNTRSRTVMNEEDTTKKSMSISSIQKNNGKRICFYHRSQLKSLGQRVGVKRAGTKRTLNKEKQSFNERGAALASDEMITNSSIDQRTYSMLQPVAFDAFDNLHGPPNSPRPLIIDTTEETVYSQVRESNVEEQKRSNETFNSSRTPLGNKKSKNKLSNNVANSYVTTDYSTNSDEQEISTNNNKTNVNRAVAVDTNTSNAYSHTPNHDRNVSNTYSQTPSQSIVVSVDRSPRSSNEENAFNRRTPAPRRPSRNQQANNHAATGSNNSFSMDSISSETYEILSRFIEFRQLVKAYNTERQSAETWMRDFARLKRKYKQLQENSFPRPPASALNYLLDLVTQIQRSSGQSDSRTDEQLARDLGVNQIILMSLKHSTPQQTALNVFNHLYPGYSTKIELDSIAKLELLKPGLVESILVFAQRAAPGVRYKMEDVREALSSCIRGARYQQRKANRGIANVLYLLENHNDDQTGSRRNMNQNVNHDDESDTNVMDIDESI